MYCILCRLVIFHVSANKDLATVVELWVEEEVGVVLAIHVAKVVISHEIAHKEVVMVVDSVVMVDNHIQVIMVLDLVATVADNHIQVVMAVDLVDTVLDNHKVLVMVVDLVAIMVLLLEAIMLTIMVLNIMAMEEGRAWK